MRQATQVFASPDFVNLQTSTVLDILDNDRLSFPSELELFNALERYVTANCPICNDDKVDENSFYRKAVKKVRFQLMTPNQFSSGPAKSKMLLQHEKYPILLSISSGNVKEHPMPCGFSVSTTNRYITLYRGAYMGPLCDQDLTGNYVFR